MTKRILTTISLVVVGLLAMAGSASAHQASVAVTCDGGVAISYSGFPQGQSTITYNVTDNGTSVGSGSVAANGPAGTASGSFTAPTTPGDHAISATVSWSADGGGSATGGANCPVEQPPPPPEIAVCRDSKLTTIPESEKLPTDTMPVEGACQKYVPPPVETVTVCREGKLVEIPTSDRLATDTDTCVGPSTDVTVCYHGDEITVPVDKQPPGSTAGSCQPHHQLGPPAVVEGLEEQRPEQGPVEAQPQTLPFTGANPALWAFPGLVLLGLGGLLRRSRWARAR